jgi:hypothetical protein
MVLLPKVKLKAVVQFPATVEGGTGIAVTRDAGEYEIDMDWSEFASTPDIPPDSFVLTYDTVANTYVLVPLSSVVGALVARIEALEAIVNP